MKTTINSHNHETTNSKIITKERSCNCVHKAKCPLSQNCLINNIIYKVVLTSTNPCYNKKKSTSAQLKIHSSCDTQTTKDHLNL